jgi:hypothetical protein
MVIGIDPIRDYMRQHDCSFPGPRGAGRSARPARRTGRQTRPADPEPSGAPVELLEALEAWSADQM